MIHAHIAQGVPGHARIQSFQGILDNGDATATFDREESGRSVIQSPVRMMPITRSRLSARRAPEKRIEGRSMAVFPRPAREGDLAIIEEEVPVRGGDVRASAYNLFSFTSLHHWHGATAIENAAKSTGSSHVHHHEDRSWQIPRKLPQERAQRVKPPK